MGLFSGSKSGSDERALIAKRAEGTRKEMVKTILREKEAAKRGDAYLAKRLHGRSDELAQEWGHLDDQLKGIS